MQLRGNKPVVYLDQNWLSEITKAHLGERKNANRSYYLKLSDVLRHGVARNKFVCPTSDFHDSESSLSSQLNTSLRSVDNTLSRGLSFNSHINVSHRQLLQAASVFADVKLSCEPWWHIPFNRNPDIPDNMLPPPTSGIEVFVTSVEMINEQRRVRNEVSAPIYRDYKESRTKARTTYSQEVDFSNLQLFREGYLNLIEAIPLLGAIPPGWEVFHQLTALEQQKRLMVIERICGEGQGIGAFLSSDQFSDAPFLSIRARMMAADIVYEPRRKPESSLLDDFDIVATILPYSNVFATENYIAELIKKIKVGNEYGCRVFTMRQKQDFLDHISNYSF